MIQFCRCLRAIRGTTLFRAKPISPAPWETSLAKVKLPESSHSIYEQIGREIVNKILPQDAGLETYKECMSARHQLEIVLQSCGYDLEVKFFGGLVTLGFFEVSGDLDLVGVGDTEPRHEEAAAVVQRVARELRRIAMRPMAIPRARIPVVRCDRTSVVMPGTPIPREAACVNFPFSRPLTEHEVRSFEERLKEQFGAVHAFPKEDNQFFMAQFRSTIQAIQAMASLRRHGEVEIPVRAPVDTRYGPELYRFPFDLCFGTSGMQNTFLMREAMMSYPGARYLLLALKKWGKATGTINSMEGFLASYAYTAMLSHLLLVMDRIKPLRPEQLHEPQLLPAEPQYVPLEKIEDLNLADIGYIFTNFFVYYNHVFDYTNHVVSSTSKCLEKSRLNWDVPEEQSSGKPPFYSFSIKDPYGSDNIARSIDSNRLRYIKDALALAMHVLEEEIDDGAFAINHLLSDPPKPDLKQPLSYAFAAEDERRQSLKKQLKNTADRKTEYGAAAVQRRKTTMIANDITESVVDWFKK